MKAKIELGKTYTDSVTGFSGIAVSRTEYLTGCVHIGLQQRVSEDGKLPDPQYFDESRLDARIEKPGGPGHHPSMKAVNR